MRAAAVVAAVATCALSAPGCVRRRTLFHPATALAERSGGEVRFHLRNGEVVVASSWRVTPAGALEGRGARYTVERRRVAEGAFTLPREEVALVEEERSRPSPSLVLLGVVSTASLGMTTFCAINPKACFGSCPTFYVAGRDGAPALQAEGFSTSVARRLEADDVDLLPDAAPRAGVLDLEVRNEAPETHYLRRVALEVVDGPAGTAVHRLASGGYVALAAPVAPLAAPDLAAADGDERSLGSDGLDLAARASITLAFPPPLARRAAVVLTARNSLMNTWVFYHLLARLGPTMAGFFAAIERGDGAALGALRGFDEALGGIEVWARQGDDDWQRVGAFGYLGPIARVTQSVAFDVARPDAGVELRLDFARAHWRFDRVALAPVRAEGLRAQTLEPAVIAHSATGDLVATARSLRGEGERAGTLPGDTIRLRFAVPDGPRGGARGYFVRSRGYYYEWGREAWRAQADPTEAARLLADPRAALRSLAPAFAREEPELEAVFRASRITAREAP